MALILHKQVYRKNAFGGATNTTLCRRIKQGKDMNVAMKAEAVTCKFCLRIMTAHERLAQAKAGAA